MIAKKQKNGRSERVSEQRRYAERDSGIELVKILAIVLIVIAHVIQTLSSYNTYVSSQSYVLDISKATADIQIIILQILLNVGKCANSLFFISSAWFFLQQSACKKKKWFSIFVEVWTISVFILILTCILFLNRVPVKLFVKSLFPITFSNNWYITCYLLFYLLFPILNQIIKRMNRVQLFRCASCLAVLYIFLGFAGNFLFTSDLVLWVTLYFVVAYMQKYLKQYADTISINVKMFLFNLLCFLALNFIMVFLGLHSSVFEDKIGICGRNSNLFLIFMSIAMFNIGRNIHFKSKIVNRISGFSLLIYLIHGNLIVRTYVRPAMWDYVYNHYGYSHVIGWVFILAALVFVVSIVLSALYERIIQTHVSKLSDKLFYFLRRRYLDLETKWIHRKYR